jgi:bifunctional DNase/RNase
MVEMQLSRIVVRETADAQCIYLREKDGTREFPIVIGLPEALAIQRCVSGERPPRPMTHDLLASVVESFGATLERVVVSELRNNTFHAHLLLAMSSEKQIVEVDARPSDGIAFAVRVGAPIFVEEEVLDAVLTSPSDE